MCDCKPLKINLVKNQSWAKNKKYPKFTRINEKLFYEFLRLEW